MLKIKKEQQRPIESETGPSRTKSFDARTSFLLIGSVADNDIDNDNKIFYFIYFIFITKTGALVMISMTKDTDLRMMQ